MTESRGEELRSRLREQLAYYRARAPEYDRWALRADGWDRGPEANERWFSETSALGAALDAFEPRGRVLELACGTGQWTERLVRHADRLTAVDAAPEALAMNRSRLDGQEVRFIEADLFTWRPPRERFDVVFFSFWLSHVPPEGFAAFWKLVDECLAPDGRIFLIDNLRSEAVHRIDPEVPGDHDHCVIRRTADGREFRVWKVLFTPEEIEAKAADLGFELQARSTGSFFLYAYGGRATRS